MDKNYLKINKVAKPEGMTSSPDARSQGSIEKNKVILGKGIRKERLCDVYNDSRAILNKRPSMVFSSWSLIFP